ncbi:MAG: DUF262 domain-containing protein [Bacteroidales bacterium]|nr:DUF262 domain-containing protein [Candidatus Sodaliphilus aphodohippi]
MKIGLKKVTVRDITENYQDNNEDGVRGYNGKLDIRPPYQREFIYDDKKRDAVITTIMRGFPLNVMYWMLRENDPVVPFELMDGQQRTISICQYVNGDFAYQFRYFHNLTEQEKNKILDYELMVYVCSGDDRERLDWFETINIAGERLTAQELRNAIYAGPFVSDAKRYFSKTGCPAFKLAKRLLNGTAIRQDYLETAIKWMINSKENHGGVTTIEGYMAQHQHDANASQLWQYFVSVITWVQSTYNEDRWHKIMKGIDWGNLYERFHHIVWDKDAIDKKISQLNIDSEVQNKKGICSFVLTNDEHDLNLRQFPDDIKFAVYEKQKHICANPNCPTHGIELDFDLMEGDHITPWRDGGKTVIENCQMLCRECNRRKGAK